MIALAEYDMLVAPLAGEKPCGENPEETPALMALESSSVFGRVPDSGERRKGEPPPQAPPDWAGVRKLAVDVLGRSKDLRSLAYLGAATLRTDGLSAMLDTVSVAAHWLDTWWTDTYPSADEDGIFRRNTLNAFADQVVIIEGIRRAPLVASREHGRVSLRDLDISAGLARAGDSDHVMEPAHIQAAFAVGDQAALVSLVQAVSRATRDLVRIEAAMRGGAGVQATPTFDPLLQVLKRLESALEAQLAAAVPGSETPDGVDGPLTTTASAGVVGAVRSRQDAIRALDAVAAFFRQTEPSSPVPYFVERAKRLVSKNFLEVLNDVVPGATGQAREAVGVREP